MNNFFNNLQKEARTIKLSGAEKQAMRVQLYTYFEKNPVGSFAAPAPVRAAPTPSMYHWFSPRYMVPVALVLVVGLSGGTAFAAQSALPGNPLYTVKINVNEAVATALATTPQAKAQVNASIATTRLEEAETLASTGKLDATTTAQLAGNFAEHADAAQASAQSLAVADPGTAAQLGTEFSSTLAAHSAILAQIGDDSSNTETMQNSNTLAAQVQQQGSDAVLAIAVTVPTVAPASASSITTDADTTATPATTTSSTARTFAVVAPQAVSVTVSTDASSSGVHITATEAPLSAKKAASQASNPDDGVVALALQAQASSTLAQVQTDFAALQPSLDATTSAQVQAQINNMQDAMAAGAASLATSDNTSAKNTFNTVLRMSVRLDAFLKAGKKFNPKLLSSLLSVMGVNRPAGKRAANATTVLPQVDILPSQGDGSNDTNPTVNDTNQSPAATSSTSVNVDGAVQVGVTVGQ